MIVNPHFTFFENDEAVFKIHSNMKFDEVIGRYHDRGGIDLFKKKGIWPEFLIGGSKAIKLDSLLWNDKWEREQAEKTKENFQEELKCLGG